MKRSRGRNPKRNSHIKRQLDMVWYRLAAFGIECREIMCRRLFYVSDDWLYPVLGGSGNRVLTLFSQPGIQNPAGSGAACVRI